LLELLQRERIMLLRQTKSVSQQERPLVAIKRLGRLTPKLFHEVRSRNAERDAKRDPATL